MSGHAGVAVSCGILETYFDHKNTEIPTYSKNSKICSSRKISKETKSFLPTVKFEIM